MNRAPSRLEYIVLIAIIVCPSLLVAGWFLISQASEGNMIAFAILIILAVLMISFLANLSTLIAIFANQRQDNQVLSNTRQAQEDALIAVRLLTQAQKAERERQRNEPQSRVIEPEMRYLESGNDVIEGMVE